MEDNQQEVAFFDNHHAWFNNKALVDRCNFKIETFQQIDSVLFKYQDK